MGLDTLDWITLTVGGAFVLAIFGFIVRDWVEWRAGQRRLWKLKGWKR